MQKSLGHYKPSVKNARDRMLSSREKEYLLKACGASRGKYIQSVVEFALETAMRKGEMVKLDWCNVDMQKRTAFLPDTKNGSSRTVALSTVAINILLKIGPKRTGRVFCYANSDSINSGWYSSKDLAKENYRKACAENGTTIDPNFLADFTFHDLRHMATTYLASKIPNPMELAAMTGHKDIKMLMRYYHPKASDTALKLV